MSIAKNIICLFVICTVLCSCNVLALPLWINQDRTVLHPILVPSPSPSPSPSASPTTTTTTTSSSYGLYGSRLSLDDALVADDLLRVHMSASPSPSMMMSSMHSGSHHMRLSLDDALVAHRTVPFLPGVRHHGPRGRLPLTGFSHSEYVTQTAVILFGSSPLTAISAMRTDLR